MYSRGSVVVRKFPDGEVSVGEVFSRGNAQSKKNLLRKCSSVKCRLGNCLVGELSEYCKNQGLLSYVRTNPHLFSLQSALTSLLLNTAKRIFSSKLDENK